MHDFRSFVGIRSSEHVEFEEVRIALRTSRVVAGRKSERRGGALEGGGLRFRTRAGVRGVNLAQRFVILSSKNCRKAEAIEGGRASGVWKRWRFAMKKVIKSFPKFSGLLTAGSN